jgi:hypothetical protein
MEPKKIIKKTKDKLTFAQFCNRLAGYRFYKDSDLAVEIHKYQLFHYHKLWQAEDAFQRFFSVKIQAYDK